MGLRYSSSSLARFKRAENECARREESRREVLK
jgi:hypothetical protein